MRADIKGWSYNTITTVHTVIYHVQLTKIGMIFPTYKRIVICPKIVKETSSANYELLRMMVLRGV